jgi:ABC-2 type transport system ATP-binding protein
MAPAGPERSVVRTMSAAIEIRGMSKRFGGVEAVRDLSFEVQAGRVTGFLGPNGAGKSTTLRMLLGLIHANSGEGTFAGRRYEELPHPSAQVGVVLEEASFHPGRTGRNHLRVLAAAGRHPAGRVEEVLETVGLAGAANRRVKGYSMGMRQRLSIAAALLGDPEVLILDEPANGLDPPGIRWMRDLLRAQAAVGRAVLVSSHLLSEVAQAADDVVVIAGGVLRASGPLDSVLGGPDGPVTRVRAAEAVRLAELLRARGMFVERDGAGPAGAPAAGPERGTPAAGPHRGAALIVRGTLPDAVGGVAAEHGIALSELVAVSRSLEDAFLELTAEAA